ncbi:hypothetical protein TNCT_330021 [Trichonephila clavata]|uniref:Uncharacterized protein n=1 Tax=Trichonephila clavata TaxID=2740835 RepID=A0A8X6GIX0_TRICU|nr:hypothetical protein TNCT_330021 [Trichonephila clavata]
MILEEQRLEDDNIRHAVSRKQRLESDRHHHPNQREFESQEQHDIRATEQCDRYYESQIQRIERLAKLHESVSAIRLSETNFD